MIAELKSHIFVEINVLKNRIINMINNIKHNLNHYPAKLIYWNFQPIG